MPRPNAADPGTVHEIRVAYARLDGREHIIECHCGRTFTGTGETARLDATALYQEHKRDATR